MSRYLEIVKKLESINETKFQELCDHIFYLEHPECTAFGRTGSMMSKDKTTVGTPDSFVMLPNGNFSFMEATTNRTNKNKLKNDIASCYDFNKTKIEADRIIEIVLFFNWTIKPAEAKQLEATAKSNNPYVQIELWSIEKIAFEIYLNYYFLANEFLNLPIDSGQIVTRETFKKEFSRSAKDGISTALDHTFLCREKEQEQFFQDLNESDFVIISGQSGIGKTKFALEALDNFGEINREFKIWFVSNKGATFENDLYSYLHPDTDCILCIDDGNKVDYLSQIVLFYKTVRTRKLKIVITVRDYAIESIKSVLIAYKPKVLVLDKFKDDEILEIIKEEPLHIINHIYFDPILKIADGNIRLAILVAQIAKKHQNVESLQNVSEVFDIYFNSIMSDKPNIALSNNQRILALIYLYNIVKIDDIASFELYFKPFKIKYKKFNDSILELEKLELVDLNFNRVKLNEQNFGLYMFKLSFLTGKDGVFYKLLAISFEKWYRSINEVIVSSVNLFGVNDVKNKIIDDILRFWHEIKNSTNVAIKFIEVFWFMIPKETLNCIEEFINELPYSETRIHEIYPIIENKNHFKRNPVIEILGDMIYYDIAFQHKTFDLIIKYLSKEPHLLGEVIEKIRIKLIFKEEDSRHNFVFQKNFFKYLFEKLESRESISEIIFLNIAGDFLKTELQYSQPGRKGTIKLIYHKPGLKKNFIEIRNGIWNKLKIFMITDKEKVIAILEKIRTTGRNENKDLINHDIPYVLGILNLGCNPADVIDCIFVHKTIRYFEILNLSSESFTNTLLKFSSQDYLYFQDYNYDFWFERNEVIEIGHETLKNNKIGIIKAKYIFNELEGFKQFYCSYKKWFTKLRSSDYMFNGFDIMIEANFENNFNIGIQILEEIINDKNEIGYIPYGPFKNNLKNLPHASEILYIIKKYEFPERTSWLIQYLKMIDDKIISYNDCELLFQILYYPSTAIYLQLHLFEKYLKIDNFFFQKLLKSIVQKNQKEGIKIHLWGGSFDDYFEKFGDDLILIKECYLQQRKIGDHFDHDGKGFQKICSKDKGFIKEFIDTLIKEKWIGIADPGFHMGFVWALDDIESTVFEIFDKTLELEIFSFSSEIFLNIFFKSIKQEHKVKSEKFLESVIQSHSNNVKMIDAIFDIVLHSIPEKFEHFILIYLNCNSDAKCFEKIEWFKMGVLYGRDASTADIKAKKWQTILDIITNRSEDLEFLEIKSYIMEQVDFCHREKLNEQKRKFISGW